MKTIRHFLFALVLGHSSLLFAADAKPLEIKLSPVGNTMVFNKKAFTVKASQAIKVTLKNVATADSNMSHNFVLVAPGAEAKVMNEGMAAGEAGGYVKASPEVLAHTPLAKPGETVSVTFTAPTAKGSYTFLCTFPGHGLLMRGVMKVE